MEVALFKLKMSKQDALITTWLTSLYGVLPLGSLHEISNSTPVFFCCGEPESLMFINQEIEKFCSLFPERKESVWLHQFNEAKNVPEIWGSGVLTRVRNFVTGGHPEKNLIAHAIMFKDEKSKTAFSRFIKRVSEFLVLTNPDDMDTVYRMYQDCQGMPVRTTPAHMLNEMPWLKYKSLQGNTSHILFMLKKMKSGE